MDPNELILAIRASLREHARELELDPETARIDYVLNWGGFVNRSYRISGETRRYHLKLASDPDVLEALRQWRSLGDALVSYHAPPIVAWIEPDSGALAGPLTPWIDGQSPDRMTCDLIGRILPVIASMHADAGLAARIASSNISESASETYLTTYADRFLADLELIVRHRPAFVSDSALRLMTSEAARVENIVRHCAAFRETVHSPIHADLWANNFLIDDDGDWWLLDWDDLRIGDPVLDLAMLLGPSTADLRPAECPDVIGPFLTDDARRERFHVYQRAMLLDWTIDSLADYVDADAAPEYTAEVRAEKERVHRQAFELYRTKYPG